MSGWAVYGAKTFFTKSHEQTPKTPSPIGGNTTELPDEIHEHGESPMNINDPL